MVNEQFYNSKYDFSFLTMWKGAQNKCNIVAYPGCTIGGHVTCSFDIILRCDHPLNLSRLILLTRFKFMVSSTYISSMHQRKN